MRKISWNDELARIAQMWAVQCNMELDYYRTALIDGGQVQFGQNIARFEFNNDIGISETQINELVNYWINSYEPQVLDLINNKYTYQPPQDCFGNQGDHQTGTLRKTALYSTTSFWRKQTCLGASAVKSWTAQ